MQAEAIATALAAIEAITDPAERAQATSDALRAVHEANHNLAEARRTAVQELHEQGWSHARISTVIGTHRSRVGQILSGEPTGVGTPGRKPKKAETGTEADTQP